MSVGSIISNVLINLQTISKVSLFSILAIHRLVKCLIGEFIRNFVLKTERYHNDGFMNGFNASKKSDPTSKVMCTVNKEYHLVV